MLQDVKAGRRTEIDYINGYVVKRGKEQGVKCPMNEQLIDMVKTRKVINDEETERYFPSGGQHKN